MRKFSCIDNKFSLALSVLLVAATLMSLSIVPSVTAASNSGPGSPNSGSGNRDDVTNSQTAASQNTTGVQTGSDNSPQSLLISDKPLAVGHYNTTSENSVNNSTLQISIAGNTIITLPNSTETITTSDTGNATITFTESGSAILEAQVHMTTADGLENATITATEFFSSENAPGRGVAYFSTNSTGKLAPLNGIIAVTLDEEQPDESVKVSFFEWGLASNQTSPTVDTGNNMTGNQTTSPTTGSVGGGTIQVSITSGSSSKTQNAFDPNPVQAKVGDTIVWTNNDSTPHTVTSGSNGQPDNKFNSSPNLNPLVIPGQTFEHTFTEAGDYSYFCMLHPNMVGTISVS